MSKKTTTDETETRLTIDPVQEAPAQEAAATEAPQPETAEEPQGTAAGHPTLKEVIRQQATEDEAPLSQGFTLRKILGGDILTTSTMRNQIWVFVLITLFVVVYISNRYSCQQYLVEIDKLNKELQDAKYRALSSSSALTEQSRQSHVLEMLKANNDSTLHIANQPPYIINVPEK